MDVLLVDDSRVMRGLVRRTLRQAGFDVGQVIEAENGQEGLDALAKSKVDLVLCDWNMPVMTGIDFLTALRQAGNTVKFGFVTSESTPAMRARATASGALFLLTKPFGAEEMHHVLTSAGLKASSKPATAGGVGYTALAATAFDGKLVQNMLSSLVNVAVQVKPGPKLVPTGSPCFAAAWVDAETQIRYAGFCELPLAAALGGALGLRPAAWVIETLKAKDAVEVLRPSVYEVFNVMSRSFNDCGSVHVKIQALHDPGAAPPPVLQFDREARTRLDFLVTVPGFATGKLSIVSKSAPEFIAKT
jgi:CheY-like chemotaxis protein